jgi:hypothetical protein
MTHLITHTLLRWLPADSRRGVVRRAGVVWGVALVIALLQTLLSPAAHAFDTSLVYSYGISTCIWFLSDPMRVYAPGCSRSHPITGASPAAR